MADELVVLVQLPVDWEKDVLLVQDAGGPTKVLLKARALGKILVAYQEMQALGELSKKLGSAIFRKDAERAGEVPVVNKDDLSWDPEAPFCPSCGGGDRQVKNGFGDGERCGHAWHDVPDGHRAHCPSCGSDDIGVIYARCATWRGPHKWHEWEPEGMSATEAQARVEMGNSRMANHIADPNGHVLTLGAKYCWPPSSGIGEWYRLEGTDVEIRMLDSGVKGATLEWRTLSARAGAQTDSEQPANADGSVGPKPASSRDYVPTRPVRDAPQA